MDNLLIDIDEKIISRIEDILNKLDILNKKIITKYFILIRDKKYNCSFNMDSFSDDLTYIDITIDFNESDKNESRVKSVLPYYYKIINLYVHLCSIMDTLEDVNTGFIIPRNVKKLIGHKFTTIKFNIFDSPNFSPNMIAREQFSDKDWKKGSVLASHFQFIENEIRKLMYMANKLNSEIQENGDLRIEPKLGTSEYDYMEKEYMQDESHDVVLDAPQYGDTSTWFDFGSRKWIKVDEKCNNIEEIKQNIIEHIEDSCLIQVDKLPIKSNDVWSGLLQNSNKNKIKTAEEIKNEQLYAQQEYELKKLYEAFGLNIISKKEYYSKVNQVMYKYRMGNILNIATSQHTIAAVPSINDVLKQQNANKKNT